MASKPLREFVYLDEVSVTSLLSSIRGAIPSEFTETLNNTMRAELNSGLEASGALVKANVGSVLESTQSQGSQVVRKATIQATFKDFYDERRESFAVRPASGEDVIPSQGGIIDLIASPDPSPWVAGNEKLTRGSLVEIEVELQADPVFRISAIVSTYMEIIEDNEEFAAEGDREAAAKASSLNKALEKLMAGLVPIKCRVVDYDAVALDGRQVMMHRRLTEGLPELERSQTKPLYLVGVAEHGLFWKDIRRVLFSKARVKVLCRLNYEGIRESWTPVKLADVLSEIVPSFGHEMNSFSSGALQAMISGAEDGDSMNELRIAALVGYGDLLANTYGLQLTEVDRQLIATLAAGNAASLSTITESRPAFQAIADFLRGRFGCEFDPTILAELRMRARGEAGLHGAQPGQPVPSDRHLAADADDRYIDAEIVAIYW